MKKIGIITVHRLPNWGSALQGYALQKVVESLGYECECINYTYPNSWHVARGSNGKGRIKLKTKLAISLGLRAHSKWDIIEGFVKKEINESKVYSSFEDIHTDIPKYDIYISGSDQIWNWKTMHGDTTYLLDFVPKDKPKIAYSSSFSVNYIPENLKETYKRLLSEYKSLSVRESNGSKIIKELTGRDAPVVLDPSLLLDDNHWKMLASRAKWKHTMPKKYILSYMLGYTYNPAPAMAALLTRLQQIHKCPVIMIGNTNNLFHGEIFKISKSQDVGVYEFLWLVEHATVVASSSFHGTAFAVNMGVPIVSLVENSNQEDDRIPSFLFSVGLYNNIVNIQTDFNNMEMNGNYDVCMAHNKLQEQRIKSIEFLKQSINQV